MTNNQRNQALNQASTLILQLNQLKAERETKLAAIKRKQLALFLDQKKVLLAQIKARDPKLNSSEVVFFNRQLSHLILNTFGVKPGEPVPAPVIKPAPKLVPHLHPLFAPLFQTKKSKFNIPFLPLFKANKNKLKPANKLKNVFKLFKLKRRAR